jgi:hypothetical protein
VLEQQPEPGQTVGGPLPTCTSSRRSTGSSATVSVSMPWCILNIRNTVLKSCKFFSASTGMGDEIGIAGVKFQFFYLIAFHS